MIDIKFLRENPEAVKQNIRNKFQDSKLELVDKVIELDAESRAVKSQADELRANRNKISKQIGALMAQGKKEEGMALKEEVTRQAEQLAELEKKEEDLSAKAVFDAVKEGDEVATEVATEMGNYLGHAMADMAAVLDPAVFVIGGGVSKAGEVLLSFIEKPFMEKAFFANKNVKFKLATLGNDAGICGAAKLVLED